MAKKIPFAGDPASMEYIEKIYKTKYKSMVYYVLKKTSDISHAENIAMDVFEALLNVKPKFATDEEASIYINKALDESYEKLKKEQDIACEVNTELAIRFWDQVERNVAIHHEAEENKDTLKVAMKHLPEEQRYVVNMHLYGEMKMKEIAILLGIKLQSAYNKKSMIIKKLKRIAIDLKKKKR